MAGKIRKPTGNIGSKWGAKRKPNKKGQHKVKFNQKVWDKAKAEHYGIGNQSKI